MRARVITLSVATLLACGGCDGGRGGADAAPSGRACASGLAVNDPTALASPALDCSSRICLHVEGASRDLCTALCDDANDCVAAAESACDAGLACVAPTDRGYYACRKACVCASSVPAGGFDHACPGHGIQVVITPVSLAGTDRR